ncbi:pectate lyase-like adhesive domain-containing protein [Enterococcus sp. AZ192]|uniref:pectate lyase-like adhesive domain-containing protein n=1 Tax=unclassified Enterococcus TaxID=2608891 RepID=UPI003D29DB86
MKKTQVLKKSLFALAATATLGAVVVTVPTPISGSPVVAYAAEETAEVSTIEQFEAALKNPSVTVINVNASIQFKKNITDIPNRDLTINGNADQGVVINSAHNSIYGKQNKKGTNLVTITNANIVGADSDGRFFTGGSGNGPSSYGWDVLAKDVTYTGARFVHLSEGKLTFDGTNNITTRAENAWVHDLEFKAGSTYNGIAANKDHGQFSAFYFNGALINGKATGEAIIGDNANVNVKIGPQSKVNYYYPVFYDKVQKVDVGTGATFDVDAAGVAFQFIPRADYVNKVPTLNLASRSKVKFNGRGGGNYSAMKLQYYGTEVNVDRGAELVVTGDSTKSVIESEYKGAVINLNAPKNFEVANKRANSKLFYSTNTTINGTNISRISTWGQLGGDYATPATETFRGGKEFAVNFGKICNSKTLSVTGTLTGDQEFKLENYGKLSLVGGSI